MEINTQRVSTDVEKAPVAQHVDNAEAKSTSISEGEGEEKLSWKTILAFLALCGQFNAYVMSLLVPSGLLQYINADLGPDPNSTWIKVTWQLGACIIVSVGGRLSDIFGRRYFMLTGAGLGIVGCVVGATGQSINQMIASGVIFGIGAGFQEMSYACIQEILPNKYRMFGVGIFDVSLFFAYATPMIAHAFIAYQPLGWRGAYWYMFSVHSVLAIFLFFCYHPPDFKMKHRQDGKTKRQLLGELDYIGLFLFTASATLLLVGINAGGRKFPWTSPAIIVPIVLGASCIPLLGYMENRPGLKYPLLPPKLFKDVRGFVMVIVVCFVGGMLYYSMNVLWPQQSAQFFVPADQPLLRGLYTSIFPIGSLVGAFIMAFICSRIGHENWQLTFFMVAQTALISSMASVGINDKAQAIVTVLIGSSMITAPQLVSFTMLSLNLDDQNDIGIAVGLAGTFRLLGGAIATAIYTAVLANRYDQALVQKIADVATQFSISDSDETQLLTAAKVNTAAAYDKLPWISDTMEAATRMAVKLSYVEGFKFVNLISIAFGVAATLCALFTKSTDSSLKNNDRAVTLKNEIESNPGKGGR